MYHLYLHSILSWDFYKAGSLISTRKLLFVGSIEYPNVCLTRGVRGRAPCTPSSHSNRNQRRQFLSYHSYTTRRSIALFRTAIPLYLKNRTSDSIHHPKDHGESQNLQPTQRRSIKTKYQPLRSTDRPGVWPYHSFFTWYQSS